MARLFRIGAVGALLVIVAAFSLPNLIAYAAHRTADTSHSALADSPPPTPVSIAPRPPVTPKTPILTDTHTPQVHRLPAPVWTLPAAASTPQTEKPSVTLTTDALAQAGYLNIAYEGFEGLFPGPGWSLSDTSNDGFEHLWNDVSTLPFSGGWSAWPAAGGANALDPAVDLYANNLDSWLIYGPFDLSDAATAETTFQLWRAIEPNFDYLAFLISTDGSLFFEQTRWDGYADWLPVQQSLDDYLGQPAVWVAWYFHTDFSITHIGPFVDEINITKYIDGCTEVGGVMACAIKAGDGWQSTGLTVTAGQPYFVDYRAGVWTMDINNFAFVGPEGYSPEIDDTLGDFCKVDTTVPYGTLLGQVDSSAVLPIGIGGSFIAPADGLLSLRINDADGCLADNAGAILLRARNRDEFTLQVSQTGNGFVSVEPAQATYFYGEVVNVTASPDPGWTFREWQGARTGQHNPAFIVMDGDKSVQATFVDRTGPDVNWGLPVGDTEVYPAICGETVPLEVAANDSSGVSYVQFQRWDAINNVWVQLGFDDTPPYQSSVEVCTLNLGWNQVNAEVIDSWGNWSYSYIWIERTTVDDLFDFSATPLNGAAPLTVNFQLTPTAPITLCQWHYGDGATGNSCASQHEHTYLASGSYTVSVSIDGPDGSFTETRSSYIQVTKPAVRFSAATANVLENAGTAAIAVVLSEPSTAFVSVQYATSNGTAISGSDYTAANNTLTFAPGETSQSISVAILQDTLHEDDETINLVLSNPGNASLGTPTNAILTILDEDPLPAVRFGAANFTVTEDAGSATIPVALSAPSALSITVDYATSNGSATAGGDYTQAADTLTFNPGETSKSFAVTILEDTSDEPDETVNLALINPSSATLGTPSNVTLTITDNDATLGSPPVAEFSGAPTRGPQPLEVSFTDLSIGTITSWAWNFGDGQVSTSRNSTHRYEDAGTYNVTLTVTGPDGADTEQKTSYIEVEASPSLPTLSIPANLPVAAGDKVTLPIHYAANGNQIASMLFSLNFDAAKLSFDPNDTTAFQLSDRLPASVIHSVSLGDTSGELNVTIADFTAAPQPITDGVIISITLNADASVAIGASIPITFGERSFGGRTGDMDGEGIAGSVVVVAEPVEIDPSAAPTSIVADGSSTSTITAIVRDAQDNLLANRLISFVTTAGSITSQATTDANGTATAILTSATTLGQATVTATAGAASGQTTVQFIPGAIAVVTPSANVSSIPADGTSSASITALVKDAFEHPIPNQSVAFATNLGSITASALTNSQGEAIATLTSAATVGLATVTVSAGNVQQTLSVNFVGHSISGVVFRDENRNGVRDNVEAGIANVTVSLKREGSSATSNTTTGIDGRYLFNNLAAGSYIVTITPPANFVMTTAESFTVTLGAEDTLAPPAGAMPPDGPGTDPPPVFLPMIAR